MQKTSLFILLTLLTFSLSQSNIKIYYQYKQAYIGINEKDKIFDVLSKKMILSKEKEKRVKNFLSIIEYSKKSNGNDFSLLSPTKKKLSEGKMDGCFLEGEPLQINKKYVLYFIGFYQVIVEKPSKYERKCKSGFLGIGKKCTNVEVAQSFSQNEIKEVIIEEIRDIIVVDAFVDLPKEDYEQYKQILSFKFPKNRILK